MAAGLYQRVVARGFPSNAAAGLTGAGALESQGGPTDPAHGQSLVDARGGAIPGYEPEGVAPVQILIGTSAFGLPGAVDPDQTPGTHAAPWPGWAGSYSDPDLLVMHENSVEIHGADFGALARRVHSANALGKEPQYDQWSSNDPGESIQQPLTGQIQAMGGYDRVQGYNLSNQYGFDAGHRERHYAQVEVPMAYLDPAERVFIVPQASGVYTPTDTYQGPEQWASNLSAETVNATPQAAYTPPAAPDVVAQPLQGPPASAGWW